MAEVLLSIIIPCYNSCKLMESALAFFREHQRTDVEIIFIDDCSTDDTYTMLCEFARISKNKIEVIKKSNNLGPGASRNTGIDIATGEYITFLDADDTFTDDYYEKIMPLLHRAPDCVVHDFLFTYEDGRNIYYSVFFRKMNSGKIDLKTAVTFIRGTTAGKIYRRDIINKGNIRFLEQMRNEDIPFTKCAVAQCNNIIYLSEPLYCYLQHSKSITHNDALISNENKWNSFNYIRNNLEKNFPEETEAIFIVDLLHGIALNNLSNMGRKQWVNSVKQVEHFFPNYIHNRYLKKMALQRQTLAFLVHYKSYYGLKAYKKIKKMLRP